jgi:antitoxin component YwqK of YwqJK toxin-antitoxin module
MSKPKLKYIDINTFDPPVDPFDPIYICNNKLFNGVVYEWSCGIIDFHLGNRNPYDVDGVTITREETIINGKRNGLFKKWYRNGVMCVKTNYKNNIIDGEYVSCYDNGKLDCRFFCENGEFNGVYREWWRNGQLNRELFYEKGVKVGVERMWWDSGQQTLETTFEKGKIVNLISWDEVTGRRLFE